MGIESIGQWFGKALSAISGCLTDHVSATQLVSIAQLAAMISQDAAAYEAARQAAFDAGEDIPPWSARVFLQDDRVAWGRAQEQTRRKFEASISEYAKEGATAYILGRRGNAYTQFLVARFGATPQIAPSLALSGPTQAGQGRSLARQDPNQILTWIGSKNYDRFGLKQFSAIVPSDGDSRKLLGKVSVALSKVVSLVSHGRPWRVFPGTSDSELHPTAKAFQADGQYTVTNEPYVTRERDHYVINGDVSGGRGKGGSGVIHLECIAIAPDKSDEALLIFRFSQGTTPMWLQRQSEALIACTLLEVADQLGASVKSHVLWKFRRGDWVHNQLLMIPGHGVVELLRARN